MSPTEIRALVDRYIDAYNRKNVDDSRKADLCRSTGVFFQAFASAVASKFSELWANARVPRASLFGDRNI